MNNDQHIRKQSLIAEGGKWIFLSYPLTVDTPAYGGGQGFSSRIEKYMNAGDSCNTQLWEMTNHIGTHADAPRHFSASGKTIDEYTAEEWIFEQPYVVDISPVEAGKMITPVQIDFHRVPELADLFLLKTGFHKYRGQPEYWQNGPGISPDLPEAIRHYLPLVKAVGVDMISVSSIKHRDAGRKAHRAFLGHANPIILIEDMDLSYINESHHFKKVLVVPMRVAAADGAPCTILAQLC